MAVTTPKTLYRGAAATSATTLYTVPASTTTVVTDITVCNTSASSQTFTLTLGSLTSGFNMFSAATIAANTTTVIDCKQVLTNANTDLIRGSASATSVNFHINGVEIA